MELSCKTLPLGELIGGTPLTLSRYELSSGEHGPSVYLQASVHGAEVQGNVVLFELVKLLKDQKLKGSVRFIPLANPLATNQKRGTATSGRFDPVTGNNWNRGYFNFATLPVSEWESVVELLRHEVNAGKFKTSAKVLFKKWLGEVLTRELLPRESAYGLPYEKRMLYTLQREALSADMVIDLHTGPIACEYLYAPENCSALARDLHADVTLLVPLEFGGALDEAAFIPWHLLNIKLKEAGLTPPNPFESYTLELSSEECISFHRAKSGARRIAHFLYKRGMLDSDPLLESDPPATSHVGPLKNYKTLFAPKSGLYEYQVSPGDVVNKGDTLCKGITLPLPETLAHWDEAAFKVSAPSKSVIVNFAPTAVVPEGMELFQFLEI